jgi:linoleoyl-CoA desaturase
MDDDIGYGLIRVTRDQRWKPFNAGNLVYNALLQLFFQWGVAIQHLEIGKMAKGRIPKDVAVRNVKVVARKATKQVSKDYLFYPALSAVVAGPKGFATTFTANFAANTIRNVWTNLVIFCGHFPDGAEKFEKSDLEGETQGEWYLRQILGSANISGGKITNFMTGNLSLQIEHHLYPEMPSNRYAEASVRVRAMCEKYDIPYTTGPLLVQYGKVLRTVAKMSLPNHMLKDTADDAPETHSERMFHGEYDSVVDGRGRRHGLNDAMREHTHGLRGLLRKFSR